MRRLSIAALVAVVTLFGLSSSAQGPGAVAAGGSRAGARSPLVGAWQLVQPQPDKTGPASGAVGLMVFDPDGYVGVSVMQRGRQKYAGGDPTPAEAQAAVGSFTSYFGTYEVDAGAKAVTFHLIGGLDHNLTGTDQRSSFEVSANRATFTMPLKANGPPHSLTWERMPSLINFTPTHRKLIGFWKLVPNEGAQPPAAASSDERDERRGYIIYTAAGQMAVHIMPAGRKKYTGAEPTPDEALAALKGYSSYFGPYTVNEPEGYVVHQRVAHTIPGSVGTNAQRFYEFVGKRLVLRLFSTTFTAPTTMKTAKSEGREPSMITWERLSAYPDGRQGQ
jgi:hypothetical protein